MANDEILGINAYSRHQGVSPAATRKAVRSGRISRAVVWGPGGRIDGIRVRLADELWKANTDPVEGMKSRRSPPPAPSPQPAAPVHTSAQRSAAPPATSTTERVGQLLGEIFADSLGAWCGSIVARHKIEPTVALDIVGSGLMVMMTAAMQRLGEDVDGLKVLFDGDLEALLSPELRPAVLAKIQAAAAAFRDQSDSSLNAG